MMTPGLLVERMATILDLPQKSVVVIDRSLLEAGLRTRGGRGRSAANVTVCDAASLLLAVLVTPVLTRADEAISIWRNVKTWQHPPAVAEPFQSMLSDKQPVPLLEFFERLIETPPEAYGRATFVLELGIDKYAGILTVHDPGKKATKAGFLRYPERGRNQKIPLPKDRYLTRHIRITHEPFQELHRLFYPARPDDRATAHRRRSAS